MDIYIVKEELANANEMFRNSVGKEYVMVPKTDGGLHVFTPRDPLSDLPRIHLPTSQFDLYLREACTLSKEIA